ncbi:DUF5329 domain-containing protein [Ramlibacter sp. WS9]|uniref:DUF5329 domain-containing protein n=1 Tax=Ramlibacter sp. WS9 TaxID=1882741 RepID=UPI001143C7FD|nr:DUF5329 domain-containing protein [Ramlibacter sp. WS9]ROZ63894.1 hypothetical protein EEB15_29370 [Ramlibacter sp. WS9]
MKRLAISFLAATTVFSSFAAQPHAEVEQLLSRLAASGCRFQRNGSWYDAAEARTHLAKKYQHLQDRRPQSTTEDFIALAGSKSSASGKPYLVKCADQREVPSADWMTAQLKQLRAGKPGAP